MEGGSGMTSAVRFLVGQGLKMLRLKAEAEQEASMKLTQAAKEIATNPAALELRRMQMVAEVGVEHNTTTILLLPSDFLALANAVTTRFSEPSQRDEHSA